MSATNEAVQAVLKDLQKVMVTSPFYQADAARVFEAHGIRGDDGLNLLCELGLAMRIVGGMMMRLAPEPRRPARRAPPTFKCIVCQKTHPGVAILRFDEPYCQDCLDSELVESKLWMYCEPCRSAVHIQDNHQCEAETCE